MKTTLKMFAYQEQFIADPVSSGEIVVNVAEDKIIIGVDDTSGFGISLTNEEFNRVVAIVERARVSKLVATGEPAKKGNNNDYR